MSETNTDPSAEFLKHWQDSFSRIFQAAGTFTPESMPPEMLNQIRSGIFQALAKSWQEFMRSPQFLEGMKQTMDTAIAFRRMSSDFLTKARQEMQGTSRQDVDDLLLAMREMETRLTRRVDDLAAKVAETSGSAAGSRISQRRGNKTKSSPRKKSAPKKGSRPGKTARKRK